MIKLLAAAAALLCAGCGFTPEGDRLKAALKAAGAEAFDTLLAESEFGLCLAPSRGALLRRYGRSTERAKAYNAFCSFVKADPIFPEEIPPAPGGISPPP